LFATKVWHLRVRHDPVTDRLTYDRSLHPGPGSSLYGLEVAKAMGLPMEVLQTAHDIRRSLTGEATATTAPISDWNAAVQRRVCELCAAPVTRDLEVHHIQPRASAVAGRLADGTNMNNLRNLVVVCQACHDKHHAGELEIGPVKQTSEGPQREVIQKPKMAAPSDSQLAIIQSELRAHPNLPASRMIFDLEQRHGIRISSQRLRTIREAL
jgi:5-methylcytosine-specific restriction endonuclease McrA